MASNQLWREASCARRAVVNEHADLYHFRPERVPERVVVVVSLSLFLSPSLWPTNTSVVDLLVYHSLSHRALA
jgi:hypothetical protein